MTCIIGVEYDGGVLLGGDSSAVSGNEIQTTRLKKVFKVGEFKIGYTSSFRMGQLLQYRLEVDEQSKDIDDLEYMATSFIDSVIKLFEENKLGKVDVHFLVGYRGKLYEVHSDYQVNSFDIGYYAVGCGCDYALGCLYNEFDWHKGVISKLDASKAIVKALRAANAFSNGVCGPFIVI